jgi:CDP-diacylglycerol--serine O-phosphatidyltransferase
MHLAKMHKVKIIKPIPFVRLLPSLVTLIGLTIGMSAIRFALESRWEASVACIMVAILMDALDGRVARMLNATSIFGAELDSLSDMANFGIAPALIVYVWSFQNIEYKLFAWSAVLLFIVCMAIRLARFNTGIYDAKQEQKLKDFFLGVTAPAGAVLMLMPLMLDFDLSTTLEFNIRSHTLLITFYQIIIALLLPSRLPTFSMKNVAVKPEYIWIYLLVGGVFITSLFVYTWYVAPFIGVLYLCTIPVSYVMAKKINSNE